MNSLDPNEPRYALLPLFLTTLTLVLAAPVFWLLTEVRGASVAESFQNADLYQFYYPLYDHAFRRLQRGELPLWNPMQLCGAPLQADPRLALFQPLHAIFLLLPTERAMAVHAYACVALLGSTFVVFLRAFGVGYWAALLGALALAFSGASAGAMSRPDLAATLAWAPLAAWGLTLYLRRFHAAAGVLAGIGGALMILGGAYSLVLVFLVLVAPVAVWRVVHPIDPRAPDLVSRAAGLAMAAVIALALSAVQWLPTAFWAMEHAGAWTAIFHMPLAVQKPLNFRDLLTQFLLVTQGPQPRLAYIGVGALLLLPAALFHRPARRAAFYCALASPLLLLIAFAGELRLPPALPPEAFVLAAMFTLAMLVALGADRLLIPRTVSHAPGMAAPLILTAIVACALILIAPTSTRGALLLFIAGGAPFAAFRARWLLPVTGGLLALLLFLDLSAASNNTYTHPFMDAPGRYQQHPAALATAQEAATGGRVLVAARPTDTGLPANLGMIAPLRLAGGYDLPPTHAAALWWHRMAGHELARTGSDALTATAPHPRLLDFMAVRVLIAGKGALFTSAFDTADAPALRPLREDADLRLTVNDSALPRAYWAPHWSMVSGPAAAIDHLLDPAFDRERSCVVDRTTPGLEQPLPDAPPLADTSRHDAQCLLDDISPEHVQVRATTPKAGVLVLADSYGDGWSVTIDGAPAPLLRVNGMFRGVLLSAGSHTVDFIYSPPAIVYGSAISLITLGLVSLWGAAVLLKTLSAEA